MFSIIGHDLRSPLGSLKLSLDFINRGLIDPRKEDFKDTVIKLLQSTDEGLNLLENLLGWAKSQSDALIVTPEEIELRDAIESIARLVKLNLDNKKIQLDLNIPEDVRVMADLHMLNAIVRNLISNATKFTPTGGAITVTAAEDGDEVVIKVADTGVGIPPENLDKIFNPNVQTTTEGTNKEGGSGLGLLLVQDFVQKNNGAISVESTVGEGTTFAFTLPKA
jgi:two-component system sensor histidine kinase/response regulator